MSDEPDASSINLNYDSDYECLDSRLESFSEWPSDKKPRPKELSEAGFFYTGKDDKVKCFFCGKMLLNWDSTDDPWIEHSRWQPRCRFIRSVKGSQFIQKYRKQSEDSNDNDSSEPETHNVPKKEPTFAEQCLNAHNEYRKRHGVGSLKLNQEICKYSENWARYIAGRGVLQHSQSKYGENIYMCWSSNHQHGVNGKEPADAWYNEINNYTYRNEYCNDFMRTGHFTQVVWKDTKEMGVGFAKNGSGQIYVVANYFPPGNYQGRHAQNVLPLVR